MPALLLHIAPYFAIVILAVGGWGLWEQHKVDTIKLDQANAQLVQDQKDRTESAKQLAIAQTKLENINAKAQPIIQQVMAAPQTSGCGASVELALDGVHSLRAARDAQPGPKPGLSGAMPAAIVAPANPKAQR